MKQSLKCRNFLLMALMWTVPMFGAEESVAVRAAEDAFEQARAREEEMSKKLQDDSARLAVEQNRLLQLKQQALVDPTLAVQSAVASAQALVVQDTGGVDRDQVAFATASTDVSTTQAAAIAAAKAAGITFLPGDSSLVPITPPSAATVQGAIQKANSTLDTIDGLIGKIKAGTDHDQGIAQAQKLLDAVEKFEKSLPASAVGDKALLERTTKVNQALQEVIRQKQQQIDAPLRAQQELEAQFAAQEEAERAVEAAQAQVKAQVQQQAKTYVADPSIQALLRSFPEVSKGAAPSVDGITSYVERTPSWNLLIQLETFALRDFSLEDVIDSLSEGDPVRATFEQIKMFEVKARDALEKKAPTFTSVKTDISSLVRSDAVAFVQEIQKRIDYLQSSAIQSGLDAVSKAYIADLAGQATESLARVQAGLANAGQDATVQLKNTLAQFESSVDASNVVVDAQNDLYFHLTQLQMCYDRLGQSLSGISLANDPVKPGTYRNLLQQFDPTLDTSTDEALAAGLQRILTTEYAREYIQKAQQGSVQETIGQNLLVNIGYKLLELPLHSGSYQDGVVLLDADAQRVRNNFTSYFSHTEISALEDWHYIPYEFLSGLGQTWLENPVTVMDDSLDGFNNKKLLCESWNFSGNGTIKETKIFRTMMAEMFALPLNVKNAFDFLTQVGYESFSVEGVVNATLVGYGLEPVKIQTNPSLNASPIEVKRLSDGTYEVPIGVSASDIAAAIVVSMLSEGASINGAQELGTQFDEAFQNYALFLSVRQGPERAGTEFLQTMVPALSDPQTIQHLMQNDQVPFVLQELSAFQAAVLSGRSVDDFSLEWWQVELYQRAKVFKQVLTNLEIATSEPAPDVLDTLKQRTIARMKTLIDINAQIKADTASFPVINEALRYQSLQAVENALLQELGLADSSDISHEQVQQFFNDKNTYLKQLGNYEKQSTNSLWNQRLASVLVEYDDQYGTSVQSLWESQNSTLQKQKTFTVEELQALAEQKLQLESMMTALPDLQSRINILLTQLKENYPDTPYIAELEGYQKQLIDYGKDYTRYLKTWGDVLKIHPAPTELRELLPTPIRANILLSTLQGLTIRTLSSSDRTGYGAQIDDLLEQLDSQQSSGLTTMLTLYKKAFASLNAPLPVVDPVVQATQFLQGLQAFKGTETWEVFIETSAPVAQELFFKSISETIIRLQTTSSNADLIGQLTALKTEFEAECLAAKILKEASTLDPQNMWDQSSPEMLAQITKLLGTLIPDSNDPVKTSLISQLTAVKDALGATVWEE